MKQKKKSWVAPKKKLRLLDEFQQTCGISTIAQVGQVLGNQYKPNSLYSVFSGWRHPGRQLQADIMRVLGINE